MTVRQFIELLKTVEDQNLEVSLFENNGDGVDIYYPVNINSKAVIEIYYYGNTITESE